MWARISAKRSQRAKEQELKDSVFKASVQRKQAATEAAREAAFQQDFADVLQGLDAGNSTHHVMGDTQYSLEHKRKVVAQKQASLHQEWESQVFDTIQSRLQSAVDSRSPGAISRRLRGQAAEYLHATNTKLGVFRDVIIEEDYNPQAAHNHTIQIPTGDLRDPLKRDVLKPQHEAQLMGQTLPTEPLGKATLDNQMWDALHIHATPYGHCVNSEGQYVIRPASSKVVAMRQSHVPMDHYTYPNYDNQAALAEAGKSGKHPVPGASQGRSGMTQILQATCQQHPEVTGGDSWLEAKGKAHPPGPEQRRGRRDLTQVITQQGNPYQDGQKQGDQWLEARGKGTSPLPACLRDRPSLTEVLQQSSNPYKGGPKTGDQWMEAKGKGHLPGPQPALATFINRSDHPPSPPPGKNPRCYASVMVMDKTLHPADSQGAEGVRAPP
ncbi:hypothetical protein V8C86DRAFT_2577846 [Haematococcus lacustris]